MQTQSTERPGTEAASLQRGLAVLKMLADRPEGATLREITEHLELPGASVLRIARTLVSLGYLSRDEGTKKFFLTNSFLMFGQPRTSSRSLGECAINAMREIRRAVGETTQLCCLAGIEMVILDQLLSIHPFKYSADLGARCPCYSCAPGKVIVAFLPTEEQNERVNQIRFKRFTPNTIATKNGFRTELERIREKGYAVDLAEGMEGIHCVAAPIRDRHGYPVGAITIAGPASRIPEQRFDEIGKIVVAGADRASEEFNRH